MWSFTGGHVKGWGLYGGLSSRLVKLGASANQDVRIHLRTP